jgi:nucleoside-diphosphate-sugar epimerase
MPRALVTGAGGFIGARLVRRLLGEGWAVDLIARPSTVIANDLGAAAIHRFDGTTAGLVAVMEAVRPDVVFHLASLYLAEHKPADLEPLIASNVLLTGQLAEAMTVTLPMGMARLVATGTAWQHYRGPSYVPVNLYAATKQAGDDLLRYYIDARHMSSITLKLFDTFGQGDTRRKLVQLLVDAASSGQRLGMSPGDQIIDISHVDDVVDAFVVAGQRLLAAASPLDESYFVSGERLRVRDLVPVVERAMGRRLNVVFGDRPYRDREVMQPVSPAQGQTLPGWTPRRRLVEMLPTLGA